MKTNLILAVLLLCAGYNLHAQTPQTVRYEYDVSNSAVLTTWVRSFFIIHRLNGGPQHRGM